MEMGKREISVGMRGIEMGIVNLPTIIIQQNRIYLHHRVIHGRKNICKNNFLLNIACCMD